MHIDAGNGFGDKRSKMNKYDIAAYIWPSYSGDDLRTRYFWPEGIGEWQSVKNAVSKFDGHQWPRIPSWGYVNEGNRHVMEMQIEAATEYGVNVFAYDWYWYDRRPFLENCLNEGFLKAKNNSKMKFFLMWANHSGRFSWDIRNSHLNNDNPIWDGIVDKQEFIKLTDRIIEKYFKRDNYYLIDGKPLFSIYFLPDLLTSLGGIEGTKAALQDFNERCIKAGFSGVHLQTIIRGFDCQISAIPQQDVIKQLGFDSVTNYGNACYTGTDIDYTEMYPKMQEAFEIYDSYGMTYFPGVSVGWDDNPRYKEPRKSIITNNTPENVEKAFRIIKQYLDSHPNQPPLMTLYSWNEWTEGSYLQPDDINGYGYLEAVRNTFM